MNRSESSGFTAIGAVLVIVVAIVLATAAGSIPAYSTSGVVTINDYEATISKGDMLVLTNTSGKTTRYWHVTFDGNRTVTVKQDSSFFPTEYSGVLCGVGCSQELSMGWPTHITIIERANHKVSVQWPWGWGYRRYQ